MPKPCNILQIAGTDADVRLFALELYRYTGEEPVIAHVALAADGVTALKAKAFDAIILDIGLPDMQGLQALEAVCAHRSRAPVFVLTGYEDARLAERVVESGAQGYIVKGDLKGRDLARTIAVALEREHYIRELLEDRDDLLVWARQYLALLDDTGDAIFVLGINGEVRFANRAGNFLMDRLERPSIASYLTLHGDKAPSSQAELVYRDGGTLNVEQRVMPTVWCGEDGFLVNLRPASGASFAARPTAEETPPEGNVVYAADLFARA